MRKKAEKKIRQAVDQLYSRENHRLDQVRAKAGLHPKVFDKTILDMERVGTIELSTGNLKGLTQAEIGALVRRGETVYVSFSFTETGKQYDMTPDPEPLYPSAPEADSTSGAPAESPGYETRVVILQGLLHGEWELFSELCRTTENKGVEEKTEELIRQ
ncbi:MAG: hypothetical protein ACLFQY_14120, partial [Desulfococcaceae bacterium]